jgi:hypothetical protein
MEGGGFSKYGMNPKKSNEAEKQLFNCRLTNFVIL